MAILGVKGRLETSSFEKEEIMYYVMQLVAEKVTFLSCKKDFKELKMRKQSKICFLFTFD